MPHRFNIPFTIAPLTAALSEGTHGKLQKKTST
jgi:hypothetical protein